MENEGNKRNINYNNGGANKGKKLNIVENRVQNFRTENPEKQAFPEILGGLPDEQPGKKDLSRKNLRKGGFLDKQAPSLKTGLCDKQPV